MKPETGTIKQKIAVSASPEDVYDAFVDPKKHSKFTGAKATGSKKVGGRMTAWDGYIRAKNIELKRGKKIVQEWRTSEWPRGYPPSIITLTLEKRKSGTRITFVHTKVPMSQLEDYKQGWFDSYWDPLRAYFS